MLHARKDYNRIQDPAGKIPADEPVFLLRGQDRHAAQAVAYYAQLVAEDGGPEDVVVSSMEQAARMSEWPMKKQPDLPVHGAGPGMDFGGAIAAMKAGHRVARAGWNGKGMFVFLVPGSNLKAGILRPNTPYKAMADEMGMGEDDAFIINGHIDMKAADGSMVVGWLASQTDMLAADWHIVEG